MLVHLTYDYRPPQIEDQTINLLMIDDDPVFGAIFTEIAEDYLCTCEVIESPYEFELVEQLDFDLVLLDFQLGETNGLQVAPMIQKRYPHTPIVLISSNSDISEIHSSIPEVYEFLPKSITPNEIIRQSLEIINQLKYKN